MSADQIGSYLNKSARAQSRRAAQGSTRITKVEWYDKGGFANSRLWRRQKAGGAWQYYETNE